MACFGVYKLRVQVFTNKICFEYDFAYADETRPASPNNFHILPVSDGRNIKTDFQICPILPNRISEAELVSLHAKIRYAGWRRTAELKLLKRRPSRQSPHLLPNLLDMAQHPNDYSATPLADLATLIDLLSLRAGKPIQPAIFDAVEIDSDDLAEDGHDSSDALESGNAADQGGQQRPLDNFMKRFLDRIAELFAAERNGSFVSAAMLREVEREDRIDIWIARNNGFKRDKDREMIIATELALNRLARDENYDMTDLRHRMLRYSSLRLKHHNDALTRTLAPLEKIFTSSPDEYATIWNDIHDHFFRPRPLPETELQQTERLVILGEDVRRAIHAGIDLYKGLRGLNWARKAITMLCLVGKIASACHTFVQAATKIWPGYTFKIISLQVPSPARVLKGSANILSAMREVGVPSNHPVAQAYNNNPEAMAKFAKKRKQHAYVHAEVQLLFHLAKSRIQDMFPYVGASKLPCVLCATLLKVEGKLDCRKSHDHFHEKWMVPEIETLPHDIRQDMWVVIARLRDSLRVTLLSQPAKGGDFRPESTVDMTIASRITTAARATMSPEFASAVKQQKKAEMQGMMSYSFDLHLSECDVGEGESIEDSASMHLPHANSDALDSDDGYECGGCPRLTSRRCGLCGTDWFCNSSCEQRMTETHKFKCSNGALTSADHLYLDCAAGEIPEDPDVLEDFGFSKLPSFIDQFKLLGVYKGLQILDIESKELHEWQRSGLLAERIHEAFEKLPVESRGGYFPWFVENQHRIFPSAHASAEQDDSTERLFGPARFLLEPSDRLKHMKDLQPCSKRKCFMLAALVIQLMHPPPGPVGPYYDFGFCACLDESEEQTLGVAYQRVIVGLEHSPEQILWGQIPTSSSHSARFREFWQAFESRSLLQFFARNGIPLETMKIRHLETYLNGSEEVQNLPIWDLLTFLKSGDAARPSDEVFIIFGFVRCAGDLRIIDRLKQLYASLLACADILELQEAQIGGQLLEFAQRYLSVDSDLAEILKSC